MSPQQSPNSPERRIEAAAGYLLLEMADHALRELQAVNAEPDQAFAIARLRGRAYRQLEDYELGLEAFEAACQLDPQDLSVVIGRAWCLKRTDRLADAIDVMLAANQVHSEEPIVLYNLSCYYALAGDKPNALSWLGRAVRMESGLRKLIAGETDFDSLRDDYDFQLIAGLVEKD